MDGYYCDKRNRSLGMKVDNDRRDLRDRRLVGRC